jgi:hypothetical protein
MHVLKCWSEGQRKQDIGDTIQGGERRVSLCDPHAAYRR